MWRDEAYPSPMAEELGIFPSEITPFRVLSFLISLTSSMVSPPPYKVMDKGFT